ncbi:hypothetical protein Franean1_2572 [Parafrankia sp. EAN1pec]|uniref:hypothetical protein n=1 Tax=Parafrankia sp. (strain EAN1pec) TaxID=298653 RepID=UPI000054075E|nr:hypothetical protein Franean1_2572 [Frankia sp. EAN1pec]
MLLDLSALPTAADDELSTALSAINTEVRRRITADGRLASKVHQLYPTAVAVLCDVVRDNYPTASAEGVLLADNNGAIGEDLTHGPLIRLDVPRPVRDDPSRA